MATRTRKGKGKDKGLKPLFPQADGEGRAGLDADELFGDIQGLDIAPGGEDVISAHVSRNGEGVIIPHLNIASLPEGYAFNHPERLGYTFTIGKKIPGGNESRAQVYEALLTMLNGGAQTKAVVIKIIAAKPGQSARSLEQKLRPDANRYNTALNDTPYDTHLTVFPVNDQDVVLSTDFVDGPNLEDYVKQTERAFTQGELFNFLLQVASGYLKRIHDANLIHADLKPRNIMCKTVKNETTGKDEILFVPIDPDSVRERGSLATTRHFERSHQYSRPLIEPSDLRFDVAYDLHSLAKILYYNLTGLHPSASTDPIETKLNDIEKFEALGVDDRLKKVLIKMLGYNGRYETIDEFLVDLAPLQDLRTLDETPIDLRSAEAMARHRQVTLVPANLLSRIEGLKGVFDQRYNGTIPKRNPIDNQTLADLESTLTELGYDLLPSVEGSLEKRFVRSRKDSDKVDCLIVTPDGGDVKAKDQVYLKYGLVPSLEAATAYEPIEVSDECKHVWYSHILHPILNGAVVGSLTGELWGGHYIVGGIIGAAGGIVSLFFNAGVYINSHDPEKKDKMQELNKEKKQDAALDANPDKMQKLMEAWYCPQGMKKHVLGALANWVGRSWHERHLHLPIAGEKGDVLHNKDALGKALKPAVGYTYRKTG